jgi:predicted PurR-regulated permease PerM
MFNPDFKNNKVNYEMTNASVICITAIFIICATYQLSITIKTIFKNIIIIEYKSLDIYIMVSLLVTAFIIFMVFKGLADELNDIFVKLNNSIIEKNLTIKELEEKLVTISKLEDENINNLTNLVINLNIEEEEYKRPKRQYRKTKMY